MTKIKLNGTRAGIIAASLLASSVAFAGGPDVAPVNQPFGTFFFGGGLTSGGVYSKNRDGSDFFDDSTGQLTVSNRSQSKYSGNTAYGGDLFVGFATQYWHQLNLSLTVSATGAPKSRAQVNTQDAQAFNSPYLASGFEELYITPSYGASLALSYLFKRDVAFYGSVGYSLAVASLREYSALAGEGVNNLGLSAPLQNYDITKHKDLNGISAGLGFIVKVSKKTALGFGYTWTDFDSISSVIRVRDTNPDILSSGIIFANRRPQTEVFNLSWTYSFAPVIAYLPAEKARQGGEFYVAAFADRDNSFSSSLIHRANARNPAVRQVPPDYNNFLNYGTLASQSWGFDGLLGYGYTLSSGAYLGAEVFYNGTSSKYQESDESVTPAGVNSAAADSRATTSASVKLRDSIGVALVPGYKLDKNILVFAKLGVAERDLQLKSFSASTSTTPGSLRNNRQFTYNQSYDIYGYQVGVGFDLRLAHNIFLRNEYVVTNYSRLKSRHRSNCCSGNGVSGFFVSNDDSYTATSNTYKLGLEYKLPV